ncbi:hypothetical protein [Isorropodon fossajaponicum symbiont]|uniref:hypothetical protein n=1 Tax=Isorropodon fossajaponicum symbiont TaxID=883811 RepID=UPI0019153B4D|nr:hypothetical protein [Isorropodon fossajaponicum symbiont]
MKLIIKVINKLKSYKKKLQLLQWTYKANNDLIIAQEANKLIVRQFKEGKFNRFDVIVRYLAIENHFNQNDCGFSLYRKMQIERGFIDGTE